MNRYNLQSYFTQLRFNEEQHKYTVDGKELTSVTTYVKKFIKPFDVFMMSHRVANSRKNRGLGLTAEYFRKYWKFKGEMARSIGNITHFFAESMPHFTEPSSPLEKAVIAFYEDIIKDKEVIEAKELMCYYKGLSGTVDLITSDDKGLIIRDYKTSKDLNRSYGKMLAPFNSLKDSQLNQYSLQLLLYAYIIEKVTGNKAYKLEIVKLSDDGYEISQINEEVRTIFNELID